MIYRATDPLPNAMTVPLPSFGLTEEPDTCAVCGAEEYDCKDTRYGLLCSSCVRPCEWCADCMLAQPGEMHEDCKRDAEDEAKHTDGRRIRR